MTQRAGELCHRVTIQKHEVTYDENNYETGEGWTDLVSVWGKLTHLSGRDLLAAQAAQSQTVARLKIRYREDVDTTMRVIHKGRIYAITSPPLSDPDTGNIYITFTLSGGIEKYYS